MNVDSDSAVGGHRGNCHKRNAVGLIVNRIAVLRIGSHLHFDEFKRCLTDSEPFRILNFSSLKYRFD